MSFHGKLKKNHVTKVKPANCQKFFLSHIHILDGRLQIFKLGKLLDTRARQNAYISLLRNVLSPTRINSLQFNNFTHTFNQDAIRNISMPMNRQIYDLFV
jgi:hypothetical protein